MIKSFLQHPSKLGLHEQVSIIARRNPTTDDQEKPGITSYPTYLISFGTLNSRGF